mmetsp:Transcript_2128/g.5398  ORF Transcript_2128/g.5398 Transcript_2128/m.5398 type:complete len:488 (-) Transcript_2128:220-1683(-)
MRALCHAHVIHLLELHAGPVLALRHRPRAPWPLHLLLLLADAGLGRVTVHVRVPGHKAARRGKHLLPPLLHHLHLHALRHRLALAPQQPPQEPQARLGLDGRLLRLAGDGVQRGAVLGVRLHELPPARHPDGPPRHVHNLERKEAGSQDEAADLQRLSAVRVEAGGAAVQPHQERLQDDQHQEHGALQHKLGPRKQVPLAGEQRLDQRVVNHVHVALAHNGLHGAGHKGAAVLHRVNLVQGQRVAGHRAVRPRHPAPLVVDVLEELQLAQRRRQQQGRHAAVVAHVLQRAAVLHQVVVHVQLVVAHAQVQRGVAVGVAVVVDARAVALEVAHNVLLSRARRERQRVLAIVHHAARLEESAVAARTHVCARLDQELDHVKVPVDNGDVQPCLSLIVPWRVQLMCALLIWCVDKSLPIQFHQVLGNCQRTRRVQQQGDVKAIVAHRPLAVYIALTWKQPGDHLQVPVLDREPGGAGRVHELGLLDHICF